MFTLQGLILEEIVTSEPLIQDQISILKRNSSFPENQWYLSYLTVNSQLSYGIHSVFPFIDLNRFAIAQTLNFSEEE